MTSFELTGAVLVLALAGMAHGVFGIGFAMIATPLLALFLDYRSAVFLSAFPLLVMATWWLVEHRRLVAGARIPTGLLPGIVVGAACGVALQAALSQRASLLLLSALLGMSVLVPMALTHWRPGIRKIPWQTAPVLGSLAGVTESALNVGAPFMVLYGGLAGLGRWQQLLALNLCFCIGKAIQVGLTASAAPSQVTGTALGFCTVAGVMAYRVGDRWAARFSDRAFARLLRAFLGCMVLALVARAFLSS